MSNKSNPVVVVEPGIVRCLLKQTFYLRVPTGRDDDLDSRTIALPPNTDVMLAYRDFDLVRADLIALNTKNIVRIVKYPEFLPEGTPLNLEIQVNGVPVATDFSALNFTGIGASVTDGGNNIADITFAMAVGGATPPAVSENSQEGSDLRAARVDHTHQGVHAMRAGILGSQRYGDVTLQAGSNIMITDIGSGTFSFDVVVGATDELQVFAGTGLTITHNGGRASFDGSAFTIPSGGFSVPPNSTVEVYVDIDGVVKSANSAPANAVWMATVVTDGAGVTGVVERRVFLNQNLVWGTPAEITMIYPDATVSAGTSEMYARADHQHAIETAAPIAEIEAGSVDGEGVANTFSRSDHVHSISTAAPSTQGPDQANAEGSSPALARADHIHNIPADVAVTIGASSTNTEGLSTSFARADHTHDLLTGVVATQLPNQSNAEGSSPNLARADHIHFIPVGSAVGIDANTADTEGVAVLFARADHTHSILTDAPTTQNPDLANFAGISAALSRADHIHNIPAASAVTILPEAGNSEGSSTSFARADHVHNIPTNIGVSLSAASINGEGTALSFSRSDHSHDLVTGVPSTQNPDLSNAEGVSAELARADHVHNIPTAIAVTIGVANSQGSSSNFARADHIHAHGSQAGGTLHAEATPSVAGFMSASDKTKLDNLTELDIQKDDVTITPDVEVLNFEGPNVSVTDDGGNKVTIFIGNTPALHSTTHLPNGSDPIATAAPLSPLSATTINAIGSANSLSKSDHSHAIITGTPVTLTPDLTNSTGSASALARADHVHNIPADIAVSLDATTINTEGSATSFSRADHTHDLITGTPVSQVPDQLNSEGTSNELARADHVHNIPTEIAVTVGTVNAEGVSTSFSRADHVHSHGDQAGGNLHALATPVVAGFMSAADKDKLDNLTEFDIQQDDVSILTDVEVLNFEGPKITITDEGGQKVTVSISDVPGLHAASHLPGGVDALSTAAPSVTLSATTLNAEGSSASFSRADHIHAILTGSAVTQLPDQANALGISSAVARADHIHNIPTALPVTLGITNIQGVSSSFSRADHVHAHGSQPGGSLHDLVTTSVAGFMSATDKVKIDFIEQPDVQQDNVTIGVDTKIFNFEGPTVLVTDDGGNKVTIFVGDVPGIHATTHLPNGSDPIPTAAGVTLSAISVNGSGATNFLSRADHTHAITTGNVNFLGSGVGPNQIGTGAALARADHVHGWQEVTSFLGLPASPNNGQIVYANYGIYRGFFSYDSVRSKWLSLDLFSISWNSNTNTSTINITLTAHDDNTQEDNDYPVALPITVIGLMGTQSNPISSGNSTTFQLNTFDLSTGTQTEAVASVTLNSVGQRAIRDLTLNTDINDFSIISSRRVKETGNDPVTRPSVMAMYRVRLS